MATTTIPWNDGSGDNIYLTYPSASGDQTVEVSSDANTGSARSKVVTFTSGVGNITQQLTVNQEAGEIPGGGLSDYVQNGLYMHLDGKEKGGTANVWSNLAGSGSFTNYGAAFNSDHIYFDGVDDYLRSTNYGSTAFPLRTAGTIEFVIDNENSGTLCVILIGRGNGGRLAAAIQSDGGILYATDNTTARAYYYPISTISKGSFSVSSARYYQNGSLMSLSSSKTYLSGVNGSYCYIGRRNSGLYFKGKIYSIRMYTRQLTQAEVLQNLSVDNLRFNLGLTL